MAKKIYIKRTLEIILQKLIKQFPAIVLTGPRQSGKSTLLKELFSKTHNYLSFDDPVVLDRAIADPKFFLENTGKKIIIDEIQYAPQILSYVKMLIDKDRNQYGRFIFTGSQQFTMMKNLGETLAGRIAVVELLPFCVEEKIAAQKNGKTTFDTKKSFTDACLTGSFPEIVTHRKMNANFWYSAYQKTFLERDVRAIYNIGNLRDFQRFMQLLAARVSQMLNLSTLSSDLGVAVNTIKRWLSILEASRIIYLLPPYYENLGKRITKNPKVYFLDCGILCYLLSISDENYLLNGPMAGALFENFCIQETIKYIFNRAIKAGLFYVRTHNALEIDILIEKDRKLFPLEIKLTRTPGIGMGGPIKRFKELFSKLSVMQGKIVSLSNESFPLTTNVDCQSFSDYLSWLKKF